jgi:hypothetical protein
VAWHGTRLTLAGSATEIPTPPSDHIPLAASFVNSDACSEVFSGSGNAQELTSTDGSPIVVSTAQFVPVTLPLRTK